MIEIHIANPKIGEFRWEPPPEFQAVLMGLSEEGRKAAKTVVGEQIEALLCCMMGLICCPPDIMVSGVFSLKAATAMIREEHLGMLLAASDH